MQHIRTVKLGEIATVAPEGYQPKGEKKYYIGLEHIQKDTGKIVDEAKEELITTVKNRFYAGEILYGKLRPYLNKVALASCEGVCSTDILVLRPTSKIEPRYLFHYMLSDGFVRDMSANVSGANLPRVSTKYILSYPVPLPDLDTQRHIASVLDKADALRQKDRQLVAYYEQLPQAVFLEMFGDPVRNEKGWEVRAARELIRDIVAGDSYGGDERPLQDNELGVLKVSAVTSGYFRPDEYKAVPISSIRKTVVKPRAGDLLFSRANTRELVAATCIVAHDYEKVFLPDKLWRIDLDKQRANPYYVKMLLSHRRFRDSLTKTATGTSGSMLNVSMEKLKALKMPVPAIKLQNEFADVVGSIEQQTKLVTAQRTASEALFQSLLHGYFG